MTPLDKDVKEIMKEFFAGVEKGASIINLAGTG